jgi:hypothetical protein
MGFAGKKLQVISKSKGEKFISQKEFDKKHNTEAQKAKRVKEMNQRDKDRSSKKSSSSKKKSSSKTIDKNFQSQSAKDFAIASAKDQAERAAKKKDQIRVDFSNLKKSQLEKLGGASKLGAGSEISPFGVLGETNPKLAGGITAGALGAGAATLGAAGGSLLGGALRTTPTLVNKAAIVGKSSRSVAKAAPATTRKVAGRYATNTKSTGLTTSMLLKTGKGALKNAPAIIATIGTYPFAGFIKEESLQTLGFAVKTASDNKDIQGAEQAIQAQEELLDPDTWQELINKVPYANVVSQLNSFYKAARTKLNVDKTNIQRLREESLNPPETFEESSNRIAEEKRARELSEREEDTEFFDTQREEARKGELEQRARDSEYFALIREGKFEEAEELLQEELKGGK